jgi:hypothetical protein
MTVDFSAFYVPPRFCWVEVEDGRHAVLRELCPNDGDPVRQGETLCGITVGPSKAKRKLGTAPQCEACRDKWRAVTGLISMEELTAIPAQKRRADRIAAARTAACR